MQDFHYNYINNKYGHKAEMMLTDTDSIMYKIETENVYEGLYKDNELFDFSNYSKVSKNYNGIDNLVVGKMKKETSGVLIKSL